MQAQSGDLPNDKTFTSGCNILAMDHDANRAFSLELSILVLGCRHLVDIGLELFIGGYKRLRRQQPVMRQVGIAMLECKSGYTAGDIFFAVDANEVNAISIKKWSIVQE